MAEVLEHQSNNSSGTPRNRDGNGAPASSYAVRITLTGHVQGVGFRPFVYRIAVEHGITGYVRNQSGEVEIVACGRPGTVRDFRRDLIRRAPPLSRPQITAIAPYDTVAYESFEIVASRASSDARVFVPPDYFMCDDCRRELNDPDDRRYGYPFINCTQCGPRYTLIEALPYDRPNTSMAAFPLCAACQAEYEDVGNRRFHAEPVACPECGPRLEFRTTDAAENLTAAAALDAAIDALRDGGIVAIKGVGGYHLMCDARDDDAVSALRRRKQRPDKPFAVMLPLVGRDGLDCVNYYVDLDAKEAALLTSPARPIVLVRRREGTDLADAIAPGLGELGIFLPYSPLHQLLLDAYGAPLVATSGNISGEPVLTDNAEAEDRLGLVADAFLHHDRPIVRPADDPVHRSIAGALRPIRVGRGSAPVEIELPYQQPVPALAVGAHMKGTVALSWDDRAVVSPHIGEMDSPRSIAVFEQVADALQMLYGVAAERIICDAHPGYTTHRWAQGRELPIDTVWHHRAHASALAGEYALSGSWLVFAWDGVGLGEDGSLWGGEALLGEPGDWQRVASFRPFRLPGGERAGREPWRSAASMYWETGSDYASVPPGGEIARAAWHKSMNSPATSAAGRLFDAAAAIVLGCESVSFEAQGPMQLEAICSGAGTPTTLPLGRDEHGLLRSDWAPLLPMLDNERVSASVRAENFHASMAKVLLDQAKAVRRFAQFEHVGLSGGVFQNRALAGLAQSVLTENGFNVCIPRVLPCNDAAICFGQAVEVAARSKASE